MIAINVKLLVEIVLVFLFGTQASLMIYRSIISRRKAKHLLNDKTDLLNEKIINIERRHLHQQACQDAYWDEFREFVVTERIDEGGDITSFYLEPKDNNDIPSFQPGQYLTFSLDIPGQTDPIIRCYSLSDTYHQRNYYRISIKKIVTIDDIGVEQYGLASTYFHDHVQRNTVLKAKAPRGQFILDLLDTKPIVLLAGGIGITPFLSMLNTLHEVQKTRETWLIFSVRHSNYHIMKQHLEKLREENPNLHLHIVYENISDDDQHGIDYHHSGFVSLELLQSLLPSNNYIFYLCGPPPMLNALYHDLKLWNVPDNDIKLEAFGPSSITRNVDSKKVEEGSHEKSEIRFSRSNITAVWSPSDGTILEFAEHLGLKPKFGCRAGRCGNCAVDLKDGVVQYITPPQADVKEGRCLLCITHPEGPITIEA